MNYKLAGSLNIILGLFLGIFGSLPVRIIAILVIIAGVYLLIKKKK